MVGVLVMTVKRSLIRNILVVRLSSIGDIVLTTPLLAALRNAWPEATIDYCTKAPFVSLLASNPCIAAVHTPEKLPKGYHYDLVVDLQNNLRSRMILSRIKASRTVRYRKQNWKKWMRIRLKVNYYGGSRSVVDRYLDSLKELIPEPELSGCTLCPSEKERAFAAEALGSRQQKTLALCFGAKHASKRYPPEKFAKVISLIEEKLPARIVLLGGKEDAPHADRILECLSESERASVLSLAGTCSLMETAAVLQKVDAVLTNDTGLMHMASAFTKPLFVIFGSSVSEFGFLPFHTPYELFEVAGLDCRPCSHIGRDSCPEGHFRCMNDISETRIAEAVVATLKSLS